jgi:hypothetical protein
MSERGMRTSFNTIFATFAFSGRSASKVCHHTVKRSFVFRPIRAILRAYWITLFNFTAR